MKGKDLKKLRKMMRPNAAGGCELQFGVTGAAEVDSVMAGAPKDLPGSLRVYMANNGVILAMSAAEARRMAKYYDSPEAKAAGIDDIGATLRELADECDIRNAGPGGSA